MFLLGQTTMDILVIGILVLFVAVTTAHQVCYEPYGCYSDEAPFEEALVRLPQDPKDIVTTFTLYTRLNPPTGEQFSPLDASTVPATNFDPSRKTVFFTHGFLGGKSEFWIDQMVEALLKRDDINVVYVDWHRGSKFPYHQAVGNARLVGSQMSRMVEVLLQVSPTMSLDDVHLIGFSIGAHICGYAGRNLARKNLTVGRITGLDASAVYFEKKHVDVRLDPTDAAFVDVIHTDTETVKVKGVGTKQPLGHIDFYPNGGKFQPGCLTLDEGIVQFLACSHYRSVKYFIESINSRNCPFRHYACANYDDFANGLCNKCPSAGCPRLGYDSIESKGKVNGSFYSQTGTTKPFCAHHYHIKFYTGSQLFADLRSSINVVLTGDKATSEVIKIPRHYHRSGGTSAFLIHTKYDLGNLEKIKVQHNALIDKWLLYAAVVRPMWTNTIYTGCYKKWLNDPDNEVNLKTGVEASCP